MREKGNCIINIGQERFDNWWKIGADAGQDMPIGDNNHGYQKGNCVRIQNLFI